MKKHFNRKVHTRGHDPVSPLVPVVCTDILPGERAAEVVGHRERPSRIGVERTELNGGGCEDVRRFESPGGDHDQPIRSLLRMAGGYCGVQTYW